MSLIGKSSLGSVKQAFSFILSRSMVAWQITQSLRPSQTRAGRLWQVFGQRFPSLSVIGDPLSVYKQEQHFPIKLVRRLIKERGRGRRRTPLLV